MSNAEVISVNEGSRLGSRSLLRAGGIGTVGAIILGSISFFVAVAVNGPLVVTPPGQSSATELNIGAIILWTILGGIAGIGLAYVAKRFRRSALIFLTVCITGVVLYGIPAFTSSEETSTAIWLNVTHIAVAVPIVGMLFTALQSTETDGGQS